MNEDKDSGDTHTHTHTQSGVKTEDGIKKKQEHKDMKQMRLKEQADERKMEGVNNKRMTKEWNV